MKLKRAKVLGYCMGVHRAVEMAKKAVAEQALSAEKKPPIYTLGPLIHNPQVLSSLREEGVGILDEAKSCPAGATVIIRAHGVSPFDESTLREKKAKIIDATCPHVKLSQNSAFMLAEKGYTVFLAGEKEHAEIKGIYGYVMAGENASPGRSRAAGTPEEKCFIVGTPEEAEQAAQGLCKEKGRNCTRSLKSQKTALIGQTTISQAEYHAIAHAIKKYFPDLEVGNTICGATRDRQDALRELCSCVDAVIIAGGKESANNRRLLSIAESLGKKAWLVEDKKGLLETDLHKEEDDTLATIGISAGASTPDSVIDEIEQALL